MPLGLREEARVLYVLCTLLKRSWLGSWLSLLLNDRVAVDSALPSHTYSFPLPSDRLKYTSLKILKVNRKLSSDLHLNKVFFLHSFYAFEL